MIDRPTVAQLVARVAHVRDRHTMKHADLTAVISRMLAEALQLDSETVQDIGEAALLHDIGKTAIADGILMKPGRLDPAEREVMALHTHHGHDLLREARHPALDLAAAVALSHHEHFDGSGYPQGLAGEAIPLAARIVAVADVYEALRAIRPYKHGLSHAEASRIILQGDERTSPGFFDPDVLAAFSRRAPEIEQLVNAGRN
ncbi:HD domain-containing phosphohydrolase [uncultured Ferrovibrio sp.]|jgi:putative two-component system response regulator|uniref:HD-GYP domain-containing protein n=1 Tax=uncultured Ferrovibrio sp. TaxID=1576913 RepID=UPI002606D752|nr:HD domain-containing phosphohydrolase [uncultured Ferrovibrio sp.]